jgi:hypothetical protein
MSKQPWQAQMQVEETNRRMTRLNRDNDVTKQQSQEQRCDGEEVLWKTGFLYTNCKNTSWTQDPRAPE